MGTQTKTIFHRYNTSYNTGVAVQDNTAQQWSYSTMLAVNTISNTGKFAKMAHPDFFVEDGGGSSHHSDLENQWLQEIVDYDEDTGDKNGKPSTLPYSFHPLYSAYCHYFHCFSFLICLPFLEKKNKYKTRFWPKWSSYAIRGFIAILFVLYIFKTFNH